MLSLFLTSLLSTATAQRTRVVEPTSVASSAAPTPAPVVEENHLDPRKFTITSYWESTSWEDDEWYDVYYFSQELVMDYVMVTKWYTTDYTKWVAVNPTTSPEYPTYTPSA